MGKALPNISESEWAIMNVLWNHSPQTANDIIQSLQKHTDWKPKTIRTLLDRLVQKSVVAVDKSQKVYTFSPLYSQEECQKAETQSFIQRIYGGTLKSMLVHFIQDEKLSDKDIKELRTILDEKPDDTTK
ncbi:MULTISPECIES: penicillinase repressor BlaI [Cytobacillus]|uniref:Penicillinase repressor BlaI n=1 Tax=Cytobacillus stercorigallinarum TaxID=2762240 RepID=A0ABR8QUE5_9BACI|nr:penicillinase repressor BlaI [Cytobacillus stercorigallinarum]MBD7939166.1 penicillinase repressor BlaI [Cytobacillus stercorigallinarum]